MVSKTARFLVLLFLTVFIFSWTGVEGQNRDASLWTSVGFEAKLVKRLSVNISQEFRFNENISELGTAFTDAGMTYKLNKYFQVAANYRFTQKRRTDNYYSFRHRFYVDIKYSKKLKPFEISIRSRLQDQYADIGRASDGGVPEYYLRNKLKLNWDTKKAYSPYLSIELFSPLAYPHDIAFDNIRSSAGIEYAFTKHQKADLYYMIQKELNVSSPKTDFIVGLGYYYKL